MRTKLKPAGAICKHRRGIYRGSDGFPGGAHVGHGTCRYSTLKTLDGVLSEEERIRTLGIGLVAIAAVMASLTIVRQRSEERHPELPPTPGRAPAAPDMNLDAIRTAGL